MIEKQVPLAGTPGPTSLFGRSLLIEARQRRAVGRFGRPDSQELDQISARSADAAAWFRGVDLDVAQPSRGKR